MSERAGRSDTLLRVSGVVKEFGALRAVDGVDLDLQRGHVLALLGPSGCGKTTLLRLIAGFEAPDEGEIALRDRVLSSPAHVVPPEQRRVGMVFQDLALFPHLSVADNVAFGLPRGSDAARTATLLALVGLSGLATRMPHQLSGGQQQRVALARALAPGPELILLDEPFSNLDPATRARVRAEVKQLIQAVGITAIFVTHDQEEALSFAERVGVMIAGRLLQVGTPADIYARPASKTVAEFVGSANFVDGTSDGAAVECELGRFPLSPGFVGRAQVMVRAENIALSRNGEGVAAEVTNVDYFGHDQMVTVRVGSGTTLRARLLAAAPLAVGEHVGVVVTGVVAAFPKEPAA
jgi:iron(III) transport system ATP-binding protein